MNRARYHRVMVFASDSRKHSSGLFLMCFSSLLKSFEACESKSRSFQSQVIDRRIWIPIDLKKFAVVQKRIMSYQRFCEGSNESEQEPIQPGITGQVRGDHVTRMTTKNADTWPPPRQFLCEEHVAQFRIVISTHRPVLVRGRRQRQGMNILDGLYRGKSENE